MKILLVGGGSGGPVSPLLAVAEEIKKNHPGAKFLLVGTKTGPERAMAKKAGIPFAPITVGKLRRYFSIKNFGAPFLSFIGFFQSLKILKSFRPDCVFGTGSYVQVPLAWAAWLLKVPVILHQQDVLAGLANKLCELAAVKITVTFEATVTAFSSTVGLFYKKHTDKVILTGNPFREQLKEGVREQAIKAFHLKEDLPTLLVLGGGTGSKFINDLIHEALPKLSKTIQIIHSTGKGKGIGAPTPATSSAAENYHPFEFINDMAGAYAAADIVLARAGLSTITELSNLKKLSIIIPMPESHQELNALYLVKSYAAIVLNQNKTSAAGLTGLIRKMLFAPELQRTLKNNIGEIMPHHASKKISGIIIEQALKNG